MIKIDKKTILTQKTEYLTKLNYNELNNLSKEELQTLVKELARRAERRRSRVEKSKEFESIKDVFAYKDWSEKKVEQKQKRVKFDYGDFTGYSNLKFEYNDNMNMNELRSRYKTYAQFLNTKTSTISGWKKTMNEFKNKVVEYISKVAGTKKAKQVSQYIGNIKNYKLLFRVFSEIQQSYPILKGDERYNELRERLAEYMYSRSKEFESMSADDIFNELYVGFRDRLKKDYEKINMEESENEKPVSGTTIGSYTDLLFKR